MSDEKNPDEQEEVDPKTVAVTLDIHDGKLGVPTEIADTA